MNSDSLIRQIAEADIYAAEHDLPETARTSTVALTEIRRRIDTMDAKELTRPVEQEPKRRSGWLVAAAVFVMVALVAGVVASLSGRNATESASEPVATTAALPPAPAAPVTTSTIDPAAVTESELALIEAFVEAWNSGSRAELEEVVDNTATMGVMPWSNPEGFQWMVDLMRSHRLMQSEMSVDACRRSGDRLFCSIHLNGPVELALTQGEIRYQGLFLLAEERIVSVETDCVICPDLNTFDDVRKWVATQDQSLADLMARIPFEPHSPDSARMWLEWAPRWAAADRPSLSANG